MQFARYDKPDSKTTEAMTWNVDVAVNHSLLPKEEAAVNGVFASGVSVP